MPIGQTLRNYLELARGSNLPTIFSNVLVGCAVASPAPWGWHLPTAIVSISLLYTAGMATNGAVDADVDGKMCPDRPIPSGRISKEAAYIFAAVCATAGLCVLGTTNLTAFACGVFLSFAIVTYNLTHKRFSASAVVMGVCRGLVYVTAASVVAGDALWRLNSTWIAMSVALSVYTAVVTLVARQEHTSDWVMHKWLLWALPACVLAVMAWVPVGHLLWSMITACLLVTWSGRGMAALLTKPPSTRKAVMIWISGICLVDAYFLALLDRPELSIVALACFAITIFAHRIVAGS